jgi:DNA polymerase-3 subunit chi
VTSGDVPGTAAAGPPVAGPAGLRVDFYILDEPTGNARLRLACRLAEKAYLAAQSVLIWHAEPEEARTLDEMLWTFRDGSFVPHELLAAGGPAGEAPVLLSAGEPAPQKVDVLINLAPDVPPVIDSAGRVVEIIDGDESRRRAGRARFKFYRDRGLQPASHNIQSE